MKWFEPETHYQRFVKRFGNKSLEHFDNVLAVRFNDGSLPFFEFMASEAESNWIAAKRPYFNVYPEMRSKLCGVKLRGVSGYDFTNRLKALDIPSLLIRSPLSPEGHEEGCIIAVSHGPEGIFLTLSFYSDERVYVAPCLEGCEKWPDFGAFCDQMLPPMICQFASVVLGSLLLDTEDRTLVNPVLLNKDLPKLSRIGEAEAINRAKRRGVIGWDIGKKLCDISRAAHYRNAHLALFWTGAGRRTPIVKFRSGSFVKPTHKISVPTGYLGELDLAST